MKIIKKISIFLTLIIFNLSYSMDLQKQELSKTLKKCNITKIKSLINSGMNFSNLDLSKLNIDIKEFKYTQILVNAFENNENEI